MISMAKVHLLYTRRDCWYNKKLDNYFKSLDLFRAFYFCINQISFYARYNKNIIRHRYFTAWRFSGYPFCFSSLQS